jgi:hypothetical protein
MQDRCSKETQTDAVFAAREPASGTKVKCRPYWRAMIEAGKPAILAFVVVPDLLTGD